MLPPSLPVTGYASTVFSVIDEKSGEVKTGYTAEEAATHVLSKQWSMHNYVDHGHLEDGRYAIISEGVRTGHDGDFEDYSSILYVAATKEEVLRHILEPASGVSVFSESAPDYAETIREVVADYNRQAAHSSADEQTAAHKPEERGEGARCVTDAAIDADRMNAVNLPLPDNADRNLLARIAVVAGSIERNGYVDDGTASDFFKAMERADEAEERLAALAAPRLNQLPSRPFDTLSDYVSAETVAKVSAQHEADARSPRDHSHEL